MPAIQTDDWKFSSITFLEHIKAGANPANIAKIPQFAFDELRDVDGFDEAASILAAIIPGVAGSAAAAAVFAGGMLVVPPAFLGMLCDLGKSVDSIPELKQTKEQAIQRRDELYRELARTIGVDMARTEQERKNILHSYKETISPEDPQNDARLIELTKAHLNVLNVDNELTDTMKELKWDRLGAASMGGMSAAMFAGFGMYASKAAGAVVPAALTAGLSGFLGVCQAAMAAYGAHTWRKGRHNTRVIDKADTAVSTYFDDTGSIDGANSAKDICSADTVYRRDINKRGVIGFGKNIFFGQGLMAGGSVISTAIGAGAAVAASVATAGMVAFAIGFGLLMKGVSSDIITGKRFSHYLGCKEDNGFTEWKTTAQKEEDHNDKSWFHHIKQACNPFWRNKETKADDIAVDDEKTPHSKQDTITGLNAAAQRLANLKALSVVIKHRDFSTLQEDAPEYEDALMKRAEHTRRDSYRSRHRTTVLQPILEKTKKALESGVYTDLIHTPKDDFYQKTATYIHDNIPLSDDAKAEIGNDIIKKLRVKHKGGAVNAICEAAPLIVYHKTLEAMHQDRHFSDENKALQRDIAEIFVKSAVKRQKNGEKRELHDHIADIQAHGTFTQALQKTAAPVAARAR